MDTLGTLFRKSRSVGFFELRPGGPRNATCVSFATTICHDTFLSVVLPCPTTRFARSMHPVIIDIERRRAGRRLTGTARGPVRECRRLSADRR